MTDQEKLILEQYADVKDVLKQKKYEEEVLRIQVIDIMLKNNVNVVNAEYGKFSLSEKRKWEYPDYVEDVQEKVSDLTQSLKDLKSEAERKGDAEYEVEHSLRFNSK